MKDFIRTVWEGSPPTVDPLDCCFAVHVVEKAYEFGKQQASIRSGVRSILPDRGPIQYKGSVQHGRHPALSAESGRTGLRARGAAEFKGFTKNLLFVFTDTNEDWLICFADGQATSPAKETLDKPDITVTTTTEILAGVMDKKLNPMTAYMQRKIQTKAAMEDLMKLQKLML